MILAGQAGVIDHVELGQGVEVGAKSLVTKDFSAGSKLWGIPARPIAQTKKQLASLIKLPSLWRQLKQQREQLELLQARVAELENQS